MAIRRTKFCWPHSLLYFWGGWGCEASCGGHHRQRGKTTTGSALDGAILDFTQILGYLVHNMSRSQLYLGFGHFGWLPSFLVNNILVGLWLNCISSAEIILFLLADILLQHRALFQCEGLVKWLQIHYVNWPKVFSPMICQLNGRVPSLFCCSFSTHFFLKLIVACRLCVIYVREDNDSNV